MTASVADIACTTLIPLQNLIKPILPKDWVVSYLPSKTGFDRTPIPFFIRLYSERTMQQKLLVVGYIYIYIYIYTIYIYIYIYCIYIYTKYTHTCREVIRWLERRVRLKQKAVQRIISFRRLRRMHYTNHGRV